MRFPLLEWRKNNLRSVKVHLLYEWRTATPMEDGGCSAKTNQSLTLVVGSILNRVGLAPSEHRVQRRLIRSRHLRKKKKQEEEEEEITQE